MTIGQHQASTLENWTKKRKTLVRRRGQSLLGEGTLLLDPLSASISGGCELYLRSDQVVGADASAVSSWPDLSGHSRTASQATAGLRPILRTTGANLTANGTQVVQFDGSGDQMTGTYPSAGSGGINNGSGYTFYIYLNLLSTAEADGQMVYTATGMEIVPQSDTFLGYASDGQYAMNGYSSGAATNGILYGACSTGWQLLVARFNPPTVTSAAAGKMEMWKDQSALTANPTTQRWDILMESTYYISGNAIQNAALNGCLGLVLLYSDAHDDSTISGVSAWITDFFEN